MLSSSTTNDRPSDEEIERMFAQTAVMTPYTNCYTANPSDSMLTLLKYPSVPSKFKPER